MTDEPKSLRLTPDLHAYLVAHGSPPDPVAQGLIEATRALGPVSLMQIAPEQGAFLTLLARLMGARRIVEIGTFTGYSALCLARGLADGGRLLCCDVSDEWTSIGRRFWDQAGVGDRIDLRIGPAIDTLRALPEEPTFDLAFLDADKTGYADYYEALLPRMRPGGVIAVDNVLWLGLVIRDDVQDPDTVAIRAFNERIANDPRVEAVMLPISDGLTLIRVP